ncbi:MAG: hypothetical protein JRH01_17990 [Deltaproteobacteria bacterium]|nr:hypothetical protein [Deltaproteobacteria bacterium]
MAHPVPRRPIQAYFRFDMRRGFDHLHAELSVAAGLALPSYALWLCLREAGRDPERLSRDDLLAALEGELAGFLRDRGLRLAPRRNRGLQRRLRVFDPQTPTPEELLARWLD